MVQPKQRLPLMEEKEYYVAAVIKHTESGMALYAMLPLSTKEMKTILELDAKLRNGDTAVRPLRQTFFDRHKSSVKPVPGPIDAYELGDVVNVNHAAIPARSGFL
jgi:hypothetical protein